MNILIPLMATHLQKQDVDEANISKVAISTSRYFYTKGNLEQFNCLYKTKTRILIGQIVF